METKFGLLDKVVYFNTTECRLSSTQVKGIRIIPTGVSKDEKGEDRLDGYVVLYETMEGLVLAERECFSTEEECRAWYKEFFSGAEHKARV